MQETLAKSSTKHDIENKDITVVVQGPVSNIYTVKTLESIRQHLKGSTVILSTWEGTDVSALNELYDEVLFNKDPGAQGFIYEDKPNNVNRIIVSSLNGLKKVKTKYVLKIRTDALLTNTRFLNKYNEYKDVPAKDNKYKIFNKRVLANATLTLDPDLNYTLPFSLSDWFFMGETEDLIKMFSIPLFDITSSEYATKLKKLHEDVKTPFYSSVYIPEQYVFIENIKTINKNLNFQHWSHDYTENNKLTKKYLLNSFMFVDNHIHGIANQTKDELFKGRLMQENYNFQKFVQDLEEYHEKPKHSRIESKDITVVVQGPIVDKTLQTLKSIKKQLPDSHIILSTWEGSNVEALSGLYNEVIFNKDPGTQIFDTYYPHIKNNVNRQIISTFAGVKQAKTKYVLKFRTDILLLSDSFLNYFNKYQKNLLVNSRCVFKRVLVPSIYTRNPKASNYMFHGSDIAMFGTREDLYNIWDQPFQDEEYFEEGVLWQYFPEQYIYINFIRKFHDVEFESFKDVNEDTIKTTDMFVATNFVVLELKQFGLGLEDKLLAYDTKSCYSHLIWLRSYYKYHTKRFKKLLKLSADLLRLFNKAKFVFLLTCSFAMPIKTTRQQTITKLKNCTKYN